MITNFMSYNLMVWLVMMIAFHNVIIIFSPTSSTIESNNEHVYEKIHGHWNSQQTRKCPTRSHHNI